MRCNIAPAYTAKLVAMSPEARTELIGRVILWQSTIGTIRHLLQTTKRMYDYAQRGEAGILREVSTADAYMCSDHLPVLAAVLFDTVSNDGRPALGIIAGNKEKRVKELRASVVAVAFPEADECAEFVRLAAKLKTGRDSMIAHAQGAAFKMGHGTNITTLWPVSAAVDRGDVDPWFACLQPLDESLTVHHWTLKGGEWAEQVSQWQRLEREQRPPATK